MSRLHFGLALGVVLGSFGSAVACGGDSTPAATAVRPTPATSVPITTVPEGAPLIDQMNLVFIPRQLTVPAGTKVYFKNSESVVHTVNINGKNISGTMKKNDAFAWTFTTPGTYTITCDFHPAMLATVIVQ